MAQSLSSNASSKSALLLPRAKARERVMRFLEEQCRVMPVSPGDRLPPSRAIAKHLDVSLSTVQNVFRHLASEGVIRTELGNGSFWETPFESAEKTTLRLGLSFGVPSVGDQSGPWSSAISGALIRSASKSPRSISIHPVTIPNHPVSAVLAALEEQRGKVDAMILHPVLEGSELAAKESDVGFPVVHLNPGFTTALTNFVSADYYGISRKLGQAWGATGRRRILFVHNSGEEMNASAALRCSGLVAGLGNRLGNETHLRIVSGDDLSIEAGHELARQVLPPDEAFPDAIYLVGDALAAGFCEYLADRKIQVPDEISVVAGSGFSRLPAPYGDLTRTLQPSDKIGAALLDMACALAEGEHNELPGRFFPCLFIGGGTTRVSENELLHIS